MSNRKLTSEKVLKAITLNQKEERVLAKTFGTLDLERKFSKNVLDLHLRTVKTNYRNLKEKVSKIKSNLSANEITVLRQLEQEGKIKPANTFNLNAALKIAAAAKRLKLYPEGYNRATSAMAHRSHTGTDKLLQGRSKTDTNLLRKRSNSVTGVFIDAPPVETSARRNSLEGSPSVNIRPLSATPADMRGSPKSQNDKKDRPSTGLEREKSKVSFKSSPVPPKPTQPNAPFSSHEAAEKEAHGIIVPNKSRDSKPSFMTDESIENNLGADLFEERRLELIHEEHIFYSNLRKRKDDFIGKVDAYLHENPPVTFDISLDQLPILDAHRSRQENAPDDEEEEEEQEISHFRRRYRQYDLDPTFKSEAEYTQRGAHLWKDINKTRYLRLPDEKLDLSGVVTLAKDQMKLFDTLKSMERSRVVSH